MRATPSACDLDIGDLVTAGHFDLERAAAKFLQGEQRVLVSPVGQDVGFGALGKEVTVIVLAADRAAPIAGFLLHQFDAGFEPLDIESRAHFVAFELGVSVIAIAQPGDQLRKHPLAQRQLAAHVGAGIA
ncbi:hypothetical protein [Altererythrobacter sp. BO-6]|uniref:hypothetical protein n=1 Tax=Altererythrobacter sp. BO-6 TaxID=2604537 RepID=UPI001F49977C|nr:hypothetical protein [Altererythrobacter sp. BO-6]